MLTRHAVPLGRDARLVDGEAGRELRLLDPLQVVPRLGAEEVGDPRGEVAAALLVAGRRRGRREVAQERHDAGHEPLDDGVRHVSRLRDPAGGRDVVDGPGPEALVDQQADQAEDADGEARRDPAPARLAHLQLDAPLPVRRTPLGYHGDRLPPGHGWRGRQRREWHPEVPQPVRDDSRRLASLEREERGRGTEAGHDAPEGGAQEVERREEREPHRPVLGVEAEESKGLVEDPGTRTGAGTGDVPIHHHGFASPFRSGARPRSPSRRNCPVISTSVRGPRGGPSGRRYRSSPSMTVSSSAR